MSRCLKGEFTERGPKGPYSGGRGMKPKHNDHKPGEKHVH